MAESWLNMISQQDKLQYFKESVQNRVDWGKLNLVGQDSSQVLG